MSDEVRILTVGLVNGPHKVDKGFQAEIVYGMEGGAMYETTCTRQRKKDVLPAVESLQIDATNGQLHALIRDGAFMGTRRTWRIGPQ